VEQCIRRARWERERLVRRRLPPAGRSSAPREARASTSASWSSVSANAMCRIGLEDLDLDVSSIPLAAGRLALEASTELLALFLRPEREVHLRLGVLRVGVSGRRIRMCRVRADGWPSSSRWDPWKFLATRPRPSPAARRPDARGAVGRRRRQRRCSRLAVGSGVVLPRVLGRPVNREIHSTGALGNWIWMAT